MISQPIGEFAVKFSGFFASANSHQKQDGLAQISRRNDS